MAPLIFLNGCSSTSAPENGLYVVRHECKYWALLTTQISFFLQAQLTTDERKLLRDIVFTEFSSTLPHRHTSSWFSIQPTWRCEEKGTLWNRCSAQGWVSILCQWMPFRSFQLSIPCCSCSSCQYKMLKHLAEGSQSIIISEIKNDPTGYQLTTLLLVSLKAQAGCIWITDVSALGITWVQREIWGRLEALLLLLQQGFFLLSLSGKSRVVGRFLFCFPPSFIKAMQNLILWIDVSLGHIIWLCSATKRSCLFQYFSVL